MIQDTDPLVRERAAAALGRIGHPEALSALLNAAKVELNFSVRQVIENAIAEINLQH